MVTAKADALSRVGFEERQKRGWSALTLEGWHQPPFYDPSTNNLTWATRLSSVSVTR